MKLSRNPLQLGAAPGNEKRTQQQVSLSSKTLVQAIRDGDVESPALMGWNPWQQWRRDVGLRPTAAADGEATTSAQESALWKSPMLELYGTEWPLKLVEHGEALVVATTQPSEPSRQPAAGADAQPFVPGEQPAEGACLETPRQAPAAQESQGPGSGLGPSPGSGPTPSWSSRSPGTPTGLTLKVTKPYVPEQETLERYQERVTRQARALESLGRPLGNGVLEVVLSKASYELKLYEEAGSDPVLQLQCLKQEYAMEMLDIDGSTAQAHRLSALESMLEAKGESIAELRDLVNYSEGARPQRSEPSLRPATRAVPQFMPIHGTGGVTPVSEAGTVESQLADMQNQLSRFNAELAASRLRPTHDEWGEPLCSPASPVDSGAGMAGAIGKAMAQALESVKSSSISVKPQIEWPALRDEDDNRGIGGFFRDLEEIFAITIAAKAWATPNV